MKKTNNLLTLTIYLTLATIICAIIFIYFFVKQLGPGLIECAEDEVKHLTSLITNNCIEKYLEENPNINLLTIERNNNNEIKRIQYNTKILNETRTKILDILESDLDYLVKGDFMKLNLDINKLSNEYYEKTEDGLLFLVSIGSSTKNPFFANIGPKIPLNLKTLGDATAEITTKLTEYGMNNALIEISIELETTIIIHMPFLSKEVITKNTIPLNLELIQGTIPGYYFNQ